MKSSLCEPSAKLHSLVHRHEQGLTQTESSARSEAQAALWHSLYMLVSVISSENWDTGKSREFINSFRCCLSELLSMTREFFEEQLKYWKIIFIWIFFSAFAPFYFTLHNPLNANANTHCTFSLFFVQSLHKWNALWTWPLKISTFRLSCHR